MLTKAQEKLIRSLQHNKDREQHGLCLVEGDKAMETAGSAVDFIFTREDTAEFDRLVTTETPQDRAAIARIPHWKETDIANYPILVVLDGVQDPGNVGAILRLCLGFNAALLLIESADVTAPKVIRASAGAMFQVPWLKMSPTVAAEYLTNSGRLFFRLEKRADAVSPEILTGQEHLAIIAGSEGQGIRLTIPGISIEIPHDPRLESLNVTHALAIALYSMR
ncbi:RNA methyltransferase [Patescibacteria group bacterium]|nr:RNA methyltransferase [Patescibacteria group bacterium]MBU1029225.1 RNA methyltransferase [Patescibacteria group bacterium]MBU1916100.1 RNA methyltransferase [Patescibacteria group bacterium]